MFTSAQGVGFSSWACGGRVEGKGWHYAVVKIAGWVARQKIKKGQAILQDRSADSMKCMGLLRA